MRLFISVNFSDEIKKRILDVQAQLRAQSSKGNFSRPDNLHLTLVFIGETHEEKLSALFKILEKLRFPPFELSFNRTGCFTHSRKELWWIGSEVSGIDRNNTILEIHKLLLDSLLEAGFPVDKRPFNAHITLGREIKHSGPIILNCPDIRVPVDRVSLMKSEHIKGILTYTEIMGKDLF